MAGACWALPMPLVTSQTYVPKNNLITWINNYHYEYVLKLSYYIWINNYHYEYVPASSDLIGEMMRAPSGWMVTRPWKGKWRSKWSDCWYELSIIWASNIVVMILILVVLFGCIRGSAVFMHDFNLETKHSLKMKTDQGPRSKYCDCHLVSQDQSFCIWVHY